MIKYRWLFTYYWHLLHDLDFYINHDPFNDVLENELRLITKRWAKFFLAVSLLQ